tara:strand:- start:62 stop:1285 length:1224 start_codon:yes stop_codon:yes gene_type:complete
MILFITSKIKIGGTELYLKKISSSLIKADKKAKILSLHSRNYDKSLYDELTAVADVIFLKDLLHYHFKNIAEKVNFFLPLSRKKIRSKIGAPDSIVFTSPITYLVGRRLLLFLTPTRAVFEIFHSKEIAWGNIENLAMSERILRSDLSKSGVRVLFHSHNELNYYNKKNKNKYDLDSMVMPLGIEKKDYIYKYKKTFKIAVLSRIDEHKKFLPASIKLAKNNKTIKLLIIGDGDYQISLREQVKKLNISDRVKFLGIKTGKDLEELLVNIDFAITSGSGLTLCASLGIPCLVGMEISEEYSIGFFSEGNNYQYTDGHYNFSNHVTYENAARNFYSNAHYFVEQAKETRKKLLLERNIDNILESFVDIINTSKKLEGSNLLFFWGFTWVIDQIIGLKSGKGTYKDKLK